MEQIAQIVSFWVRLEFLQNLDVSRIACFPQSSREALRVVCVIFIEIRTTASRVSDHASARSTLPEINVSLNCKYIMPERRVRSPAVKSSQTRFSVW